MHSWVHYMLHEPEPHILLFRSNSSHFLQHVFEHAFAKSIFPQETPAQQVICEVDLRLY